MMQLPPPTSGSVRFDGHELTGLSSRALGVGGLGCR